MIRFLLSLLAAHREAAELRVLLDCARAALSVWAPPLLSGPWSGVPTIGATS